MCLCVFNTDQIKYINSWLAAHVGIYIYIIMKLYIHTNHTDTQSKIIRMFFLIGEKKLPKQVIKHAYRRDDST